MHRFIRAIVATALIVLVSGPGLALPAAKEKWIRVQTQHFTLYSNAAERQTVRVGENLERLREVLTRTTQGMRFNSPYPTSIFVFRDERSFSPYKIGRDGKPDEGIAGYFQASRDGNYVTVNANAGDRPFPVFYHEYLHYFLRNNLPEIPLWLNEGLAEFYSTFTLRGDRAEMGRIVEHHLRRLDATPMMPLDELFGVDHDSPVYNENDRRGVFYAQSWVLTHMLMSGDQAQRDRFNEYFRLVTQGADPATAVERAFGLELNALMKQLKRYVDRSAYNFYKVDFSEPVKLGETAVQALPRTEVLVRLADLLVHHNPVQYRDAEAHLRTALELKPGNADAFVVLGRLETRRDNDDAAAEHFRKAVDLDETHAIAWSHLGRNVLRRFLDGDGGSTRQGGGPPPAMLEARRHLERSLSLRPGDAETLAAFGKTFFFDVEGVEAGVDALTRASIALPSRSGILYDLIALHVETGNREAAEAALQRMRLNRADETLLHGAEDMFITFDLEQAQALRDADRREESQAVLRDAAERAHDPALKAIIRARLTVPSDATVVTGTPESVRQFNEAIRAANTGEFATAVSMLEQVAAETDDPGLRATAEAQLETLRTVVEHKRFIGRVNEAVSKANAGRLDEAIGLLEKILESELPEEQRKQVETLLSSLRQARGR